jgi:hypothetical protein
VKRARELIYTAERQASRDVSLAGLRLKPGSSQNTAEDMLSVTMIPLYAFLGYTADFIILVSNDCLSSQESELYSF